MLLKLKGIAAIAIDAANFRNPKVMIEIIKPLKERQERRAKILAKRFRKRKWMGKTPQPWTRAELKEEKIRLLQATCEWCGQKKEKKELQLHHNNWKVKEPGYIMVWVQEGGEYAPRREHKDGYSPMGTRLVCKGCHREIHQNPEEAEKLGFKKSRFKP